jgi:hypothetical protein
MDFQLQGIPIHVWETSMAAQFFKSFHMDKTCSPGDDGVRKPCRFLVHGLGVELG